MFSRVSVLRTVESLSKISSKVTCSSVSTRQFTNAFIATFRPISKSVQCSRTPIQTQNRSIFTIVSKPKIDKKLGHIGVNVSCFNIIARGTKTKKAAAKRFIVTGKGDLKYGHAGKRHNTSKKSKTVKRRLNKKGILTGVWAKKMKEILAH